MKNKEQTSRGDHSSGAALDPTLAIIEGETIFSCECLYPRDF